MTSAPCVAGTAYPSGAPEFTPILVGLTIYDILVLGAIQPRDLNRIAKICYGHLCLMEENHSFINNYII
jgi:hypothetical protein